MNHIYIIIILYIVISQRFESVGAWDESLGAPLRSMYLLGFTTCTLVIYAGVLYIIIYTIYYGECATDEPFA